jgi:hypothetical protein
MLAAAAVVAALVILQMAQMALIKLRVELAARVVQAEAAAEAAAVPTQVLCLAWVALAAMVQF